MTIPSKPVAVFHSIQAACVDHPKYELWQLLVRINGKPAGAIVPRSHIEDTGIVLPDRTPKTEDVP